MGISACYFHQEPVNSYLVNLLVWARSTEAVQTELLMRVLLPAHGGHDLNTERWDTAGNNRHLVILVLRVEDLEARQGSNTGGDALVLESLDGLKAEGNLGTSGDEGDLGVLVLKGDVTSLDGLLER